MFFLNTYAWDCSRYLVRTEVCTGTNGRALPFNTGQRPVTRLVRRSSRRDVRSVKDLSADRITLSIR